MKNKYRAWSIDEGCMYYQEDIKNSNWDFELSSDGLKLSVTSEENYGIYHCTDAKFMQSTGIVDKSKVESYLGDIVKARLVGLDGKLLGVYVGEIIFHEYELAIETTDGSFPVASWCLVESFEIIGNKYENPELLEED